MAVSSVREVWDNREGALSASEDRDVRTFLAVTNSKVDNAKTIELSGMIPHRLSVHPTKSTLFADEILIRQDPKSGYRWFVSITYRPLNVVAPSLPVREFQPDPLLRRTIITGKSAISHTSFVRGWTQVVDGTSRIKYQTEAEMKNAGGPWFMPIYTEIRPVESSSHEAFVGLIDDKCEFIWHVTYNVFPLPLWVADYQNKFNKNSVIILGAFHKPRTLRLKGLSISDIKEDVNNLLGRQLYFTISFDLHYKPESWVRPLRDQGRFELVDNEQVRLLTKDGLPVPEPVPLDGEGFPIAEPTADNVKYGWFLPDEEKDFSVFPLVPSLPTAFPG